eukprot:scaffold202163_cov15-Tisochrysis_lutea.AAC.1
MVSMQMGEEFKKEQIGILIVWVRALEGGIWGGWWVRGSSPKFTCAFRKKIIGSCAPFITNFPPSWANYLVAAKRVYNSQVQPGSTPGAKGAAKNQQDRNGSNQSIAPNSHLRIGLEPPFPHLLHG